MTPEIYVLGWLCWLGLGVLAAWLIMRPIVKELREIAYELKRLGYALGSGEPKTAMQHWLDGWKQSTPKKAKR